MCSATLRACQCLHPLRHTATAGIAVAACTHASYLTPRGSVAGPVVGLLPRLLRPRPAAAASSPGANGHPRALRAESRTGRQVGAARSRGRRPGQACRRGGAAKPELGGGRGRGLAAAPGGVRVRRLLDCCAGVRRCRLGGRRALADTGACLSFRAAVPRWSARRTLPASARPRRRPSPRVRGAAAGGRGRNPSLAPPASS